MNLKVKYTPVLVKEPESVRRFLTETMGFKFWQNTLITDQREGIIVGVEDNNESFLILVKNDHAGSLLTDQPVQSRIIINTDDCLKDYYNLLAKGVKFYSKPQYTSLGLAVDMADTHGNLYTLLEERNYQEN